MDYKKSKTVNYAYTFTKEEMVNFMLTPHFVTRTSDMESLLRVMRTNSSEVEFEIDPTYVVVYWSEEIVL